MKRNLKAVSANYNLEYYTNKTNIANQDFVKETIEYFETGEGMRVFKPLEFLNLLEKQYQFILDNFRDSDKVIKTFKTLPLNDIEKHILFGFLLKWFGGYPVNNLNEDFDSTLKTIQKEFLNFEVRHPKKVFAKLILSKEKIL